MYRDRFSFSEVLAFIVAIRRVLGTWIEVVKEVVKLSEGLEFIIKVAHPNILSLDFRRRRQRQ